MDYVLRYQHAMKAETFTALNALKVCGSRILLRSLLLLAVPDAFSNLLGSSLFTVPDILSCVMIIRG